jgi:hypothetical protein
MAVGHFDSPGVSYGSKDLGAVLVARWLVPSDATHLVAEPGRESSGRGLSGAPVYEHELEALVSARTGEVFEY